MKTLSFFNNKGGVGKTTLIYHLAWMCSEFGIRVVAADMDPQSNLSAMFLEDEKLESFWPDGEHPRSLLGCITPITDGTGDIAEPYLERINEYIGLVVGDLGVSKFEDSLSAAWPRCLSQDKAAFRTMTAFYRILDLAAQKMKADLVLIDVGPNLGAINRATLIASDYVVMPLVPGLFSLQGLKNLGPTIETWRTQWKQRLDAKPEDFDIAMPEGKIKPIGYILMQHAERKNRPVKSYRRWADRIPAVYSQNVLQEPEKEVAIEDDRNRVGLIKNYQSLVPMAEEARKPVFMLKSADGAIGAHAQAVQKSYIDFENLTKEILRRMGIRKP